MCEKQNWLRTFSSTVKGDFDVKTLDDWGGIVKVDNVFSASERVLHTLFVGPNHVFDVKTTVFKSYT